MIKLLRVLNNSNKKMKKIIKLLLIALISSNQIFSEGTITILDHLSKKPLNDATIHFISLENKSKSTKALKKTDKQGKATNPYSGKTQILITFVGYHNILDTINNVDKTYYLVYKDIEIDEVVVTGNFKPTTAQKSVYDVKVINQEKIDNYSTSSLRDLLLTESNIRINQDNIFGSQININGITGENIKIMIDGVPLIGRLNGNIDISQINLNTIKRVEIIEGPMSSIYGSDALGGVINLISKDPDCGRLNLNIDSYYETVGMYKFNGTLNFGFENINFLINGGRDLFQGYDAENNSRNVKWNPKEQYFANLQSSYKIDNQIIKYQGMYFSEFVLNRGELREPYRETAFDDKYYTDRITNSIMYNGKIDNNKFLDLTTAFSYYHRIKNTFFKNMLDLSEKITKDPADQDTSNFYTIMARPVFSHDKPFNGFNYQFGFDFNYDIAQGKKIKDNSKNIYDIATFISLQYEPTDNIIIQPSLRLIKNSIYEAPIIPALNFKYDISKYFTFRASYAKGFRAPSIKELFYEFVDINHNIFGNTDLKAEKSDSYNASILFKISDYKHFLSLEPKFFYNSLKDMITLAAITDILYKNVNIGKYETIGGNLGMKYFREGIGLTLNYAYIGRLNSLSEETNTRKYNFSNEFSLNFDYKISLIESKLNLYYKYTGKLPSIMLKNDELIEYIIDDYNMMDISLNKELFDRFELSLGFKNVFDVKDIKSNTILTGGVHSPSSIFPVGWGRTFFVNLKIKVI